MGEGDWPEDPSIRDSLRILKQRGSALFVVGELPATVHSRTCATMLGDGTEHRRLLVRAGGEFHAPMEGPTAHSDRTRVVEWNGAARSSVTATGAGGTPRPGLTSLADLWTAVGTSIEEHARGANSPGEFRACIDSVGTLLDEAERRDVFRFLHTFTGLCRSHSGLCHAHLALDRDTELVRLFEPLFDATVELQVRDGEAHQRWHLLEPEIATEWLPVSEVDSS